MILWSIEYGESPNLGICKPKNEFQLWVPFQLSGSSLNLGFAFQPLPSKNTLRFEKNGRHTKNFTERSKHQKTWKEGSAHWNKSERPQMWKHGRRTKNFTEELKHKNIEKSGRHTKMSHNTIKCWKEPKAQTTQFQIHFDSPRPSKNHWVQECWSRALGL